MLRLKTLITEKENNYKIFCDMDGVLVDFEKGFEIISKGKRPADMPKNRFWAMFFSLTKGKGKEYWAGLPWMPDGKILWSYIKPYNPTILSAPPNAEAEAGKYQWVNSNLGGAPLIFKQARDKHHYAEKGTILIDDRADTIDRWNANGGKGILHTSATNTIKALKKLSL